MGIGSWVAIAVALAAAIGLLGKRKKKK